MEQGQNVMNNCAGQISSGVLTYYNPPVNIYGEFAINRAINGYMIECAKGKFVFGTEKEMCDWLMKELKAK